MKRMKRQLQEVTEFELSIMSDLWPRLIILAPNLGATCKRFNIIFRKESKKILDYYIILDTCHGNYDSDVTFEKLKSGQTPHGCFAV